MAPNVEGTRKVVTKKIVARHGSAALTGLGGAAILVVVMNSLPNNNPWKNILIPLCPVATLALATIAIALKNHVLYKARVRRTQTSLAAARELLTQAMETPGASRPHVSRLRKEVEGLELKLAKLLGADSNVVS
jgi:hypothetical protein